VRYEHGEPGSLLHLDTKKLGRIVGGPGHRATGDRRHRSRGVGWEVLHVALDDATRLVYAELLPDERAATAAGFLLRALRWFRGEGIPVRRLLTDNGSVYRSRRSEARRTSCGRRWAGRLPMPTFLWVLCGATCAIGARMSGFNAAPGYGRANPRGLDRRLTSRRPDATVGIPSGHRCIALVNALLARGSHRTCATAAVDSAHGVRTCCRDEDTLGDGIRKRPGFEPVAPADPSHG
jgi:hypothetical protein